VRRKACDESVMITSCAGTHLYWSGCESSVTHRMVNGGCNCWNPSTGGFEQLVTNLRNFPCSSGFMDATTSHNHLMTLWEDV
jgi:hypothetical protein